jgi:hypothetical protein
MHVTVSFAASSHMDTVQIDSDSQPSELFINACNSFFGDDVSRKAVNKQGLDVSETFYNSYLDEFRSGNYAYLWKAFQSDLVELSWSNDTEKRVDINRAI